MTFQSSICFLKPTLDSHCLQYSVLNLGNLCIDMIYTSSYCRAKNVMMEEEEDSSSLRSIMNKILEGGIEAGPSIIQKIIESGWRGGGAPS